MFLILYTIITGVFVMFVIYKKDNDLDLSDIAICSLFGGILWPFVLLLLILEKFYNYGTKEINEGC